MQSSVLSGRKITIVGVSAMCGIGKTTFLELVSVLTQCKQSHGKVLTADMSAVIDHAKNNSESRVGDALRNQSNMTAREGGKILGDDVMLGLIDEFIVEALGSYPATEIIFWSGLPRSIRQGEKLTEAARYAIINLIAPRDTAYSRYHGRWERSLASGRLRPDDPKTERELEKKFAKREHEHFEHVIPTIAIHRDRVIGIDATKSLAMQMHRVFEKLDELLINREDAADPLRPIIKHAQHSLGNPLHPFFAATRKIEYPELCLPHKRSEHPFNHLTVGTPIAATA